MSYGELILPIAFSALFGSGECKDKQYSAVI